MLLRPHHLLCIPHFTGHGYDAAFTAHMTALTTALAAAPHTAVTLTDSCDDLCAACPHQSGGSCDSAEKVAAMDTAVCRICEIQTGSTADWAFLSGMALQRILQTEAFREICGGCQWFELCRQTEV